ncbi:hypothetical protein TVAG_387730 [Trichomonas vaginalis G3]|uniref:DUF3447 domain-containing protein n=1 Tax=Trichomonas vaginalis (strain ATCC PRA-98 / G3) TaxID=412133 RepID=A2E100_TRIV3|nr:proteasome regulatory particle assembly [Trichomonas vaginalis G3]EAY13632.1 hypothetical protein TVAG_387730 [Trichomonas vaginalis G3]KAI5529899.1 proteasome regulatory particle assembly [Trichomonas vaginalis G3]|eukprot:XP_001325855.1 hypothetical protein [Trichomonas vaginalis G3]
MSDQDVDPNKFNELRSNYKYYIDLYTALYQLKTEKEEDLNSIYKKIKTELIDSKKRLPANIIEDILNIIPYNNRYTKSYLTLSKMISDEYHVEEVDRFSNISIFLFYKEYGIKLNRNFDTKMYFNIQTENTIYSAIMNNDLERFISFTEIEGFDKDRRLHNDLYPEPFKVYSLLELCCYHGAVDCFKFLRTKFNSEITQTCLQFSFLGGNPEIMSECLKYQKPNEKCMEYAIISHNIDFVTFLMNEYNIEIDVIDCVNYNNLESLLVYFDQTNDFNKCFVYSICFNIPSLLEYFLSLGANINQIDEFGNIALQNAVHFDIKEMTEFLISHGANINEKNNNGETALHIAACKNYKEIIEVLISHGANINEKDEFGETALHIAATYDNKEIAEVLISHGANINEKDELGRTALHRAANNDSKETAEVLISHGAKNDIPS